MAEPHWFSWMSVRDLSPSQSCATLRTPKLLGFPYGMGHGRLGADHGRARSEAWSAQDLQQAAISHAFDRHRKAEPHLEPGILREGASAGNLHLQRPPRSPLSSRPRPPSLSPLRGTPVAASSANPAAPTSVSPLMHSFASRASLTAGRTVPRLGRTVIAPGEALERRMT